MTAPTTDADRDLIAEVEAMLAEVDQIAARAEELRTILETRGDLFRRLNDAGVGMQEIADRAGCSKPAVQQAISRARGVPRKRYEKT